MIENKTVTIEMEEQYMRATIFYKDTSYQSEICDSITALQKSTGLNPEIIYRKDIEDKGFCSIEFSGDEYSSSRECGGFIENLISTLNIQECID